MQGHGDRPDIDELQLLLTDLNRQGRTFAFRLEHSLSTRPFPQLLDKREWYFWGICLLVVISNQVSVLVGSLGGIFLEIPYRIFNTALFVKTNCSFSLPSALPRH